MADYVEERLDMPLRTVLPLMQIGIINHTTYFGVRTFKNPLDAWVYQEIIFETRPDAIIEIGNANGGSTLLLAHLCDLLGHGHVIALDLSHRDIADTVRDHPRVSLIEGDACESRPAVERLLSADESVMVIEDSSHTYENTLSVLRAYSGLIKPGGYLIVEDTIGQHGLPSGRVPGPYEAIETFVGECPHFEIDRNREHFFVTSNPKGFLRRRSTDSEAPRRGFRGFSVARLKLREAIRLVVPPIVIVLAEKVNNWLMISAKRTP